MPGQKAPAAEAVPKRPWAVVPIQRINKFMSGFRCVKEIQMEAVHLVKYAIETHYSVEQALATPDCLVVLRASPDLLCPYSCQLCHGRTRGFHGKPPP